MTALVRVKLGFQRGQQLVALLRDKSLFLMMLIVLVAAEVNLAAITVSRSFVNRSISADRIEEDELGHPDYHSG